MDGSNGNVQVEAGASPLSTTTVVSANDLCGNCSPKSPTNICMPICFLVREQAKSLVAIQELQKRVKCLESSQGDVISAISEVHDCFSANGPDQLQLPLSLSPPGNPLYESSPEKFKQAFISPLKNKLPNPKYGSPILLSPNGNNKSASFKYSFNKLIPDIEISQQKIQGVEPKEPSPDSDKQDSGLDSDCREQGLESNVLSNDVNISNKQPQSAPVNNDSDELLDLLDEISHKSEILCQNLSSEEHHVSLPHINEEMSKLHQEHSELYRLLSDIKDEREELNSKVINLECATGELASKNKNLQKDFMTLLVEKRKLESKLHSFNEVSEKINNSNSDSSTSSSEIKFPFSKSIHKIDSSVVSAVLKESNLLDLQKQVLTYFMENEILRSKLEQVEQWYTSKEVEKECFEKVAKDEIRELMSENERLRIGLEEQKLESAALKSKVRMLERVLQSVTLENRELNLQLGETLYLHDTVHTPTRNTEKFSVAAASNGLSRRLSLPAQNKERDIAISCSKARAASNTSSFINVTIEDPESSDSELAMTLEPTFNFSQRRSSTPFAFGKKHIKFADVTNLPSVRLSSSKPQQLISGKQVNKRLNFGTQKQVNTIPSFKEFTKNSSFCDTAASSSSDKVSKVANRSATKALDIIEEKPNDPKTFPFYSILEKLKANSDYKFPNKCEEQNLINHVDESQNTSAQKCNNSGNQEGPTKEFRISAGHSKTIHKRIQNILDRITSEAEEAIV